MKCVILAAGKGNRMYPLTQTRPKVMVPIANKPILEHLLIRAKMAGIEDFIFVVGYKRELVESYFGDGSEWGVKIDYIFQKDQLGTANAIGVTRDLATERFLVLNGDVLIESKCIAELLKKRDDSVMTLTKRDGKGFGVVEANGSFVKRIIEKPKDDTENCLVNAGIYVFERSIFTAIEETPLSERDEYEITDSLQSMIDDGIDVGYQVVEEWIDVGYPWNLLDANESLLKNIKRDIRGTIEDGATIHGRVIVGEGTIIRSGAYIIGPVIIGEDCDIGPNCFIRPSSSIGDDVRVGNGVEVKNSILMDHTKVGHLTYVGDSVIGEGCNFGAGTIIANLRHDNASIKAKVKEEKIDSGRRKLGVIFGDGVKTGINSTLNVGTVLEPGKMVLPGERVR
ncbi:MAG: bifunctional sugar-1-phosphate nucleotidylyltransferase/acetyltransferase [Halobacteriota archaeon]|nr:bifunctional sugar-1-phosphate nucleotidylyltransferase/acetyltransferase [Halobacteriota archaeon]